MLLVQLLSSVWSVLIPFICYFICIAGGVHCSNTTSPHRGIAFSSLPCCLNLVSLYQKEKLQIQAVDRCILAFILGFIHSGKV